MKNYKDLKKTFSIIALVKISMILITFLITSIIFRLLGKEEYGVFMAIFSLFSWIFLFDFGIGKGMRNYLTSSLTKKKYKLAKYYISTTYTIIFIITLILFVSILIIIYNLSLVELLNIKNHTNSELVKLAVILCVAFFSKFFLGLIDEALYSTHRSDKVSLNGLFSNIVYLILLLALFLLDMKNVIFVAVSFCISIISIYIYSNYSFFKDNMKIIPSIKTYSSKLLKKILSNGIYILLIQLGFIIIFGTDRILLQKYSNSLVVADYDILYKVMSLIIIPATIFIQPLWASFNAAFTNKDINWIVSVFKKLYLLFLVMLLSIFFINFIFEDIIYYWLGSDEINLTSVEIYLMGLILISLMWTNLHTDFFVAISKFKYVLIMIFISVIIKFFLVSYFIFNDQLGLKTIMYSTLIPFIIYNIFAFFYLKQIIRHFK